MLAASRRFLMFSAVLVFAATHAWGDQWIRPTPEELQMTAEPAAPGATAIYLFRDERADDKLHTHTTYVRLKVLSEKGKTYADQEIKYQDKVFEITGIEGRTIHSDGTIIPFTGKPYEKLLEISGNEKRKAMVFSLPDVQVGSILEYRYTLKYPVDRVVSPSWYLQGPLYTRKAHFYFVPSTLELHGAHGGIMQGQVFYASYLPPGAQIKFTPANQSYSLDVANIPEYPKEDYMPPMQNHTYRALFYYTTAKTSDEYWAMEGKYWSKDVDRFIDGDKLSGIESQIVNAGDTPEQKLQKIYGAVMAIENTTFSEQHGNRDTTRGPRMGTAADVWTEKRGDRNQITRLFVGLARAAGCEAYVGYVTNRDHNLFDPNYLSMAQLNDDIAIVEMEGKDKFFDPGERYAAFGYLHWKHAGTQGIRQTEKGAIVFTTPTPVYRSTNELRSADLKIHPDGTVTGNVQVTLTGAAALHWREYALINDEDALKRQFTATLQSRLPAGIELTVDHFLGLTEWRTNLIAMLKVTGTIGTATAKHSFLPASFFEATSHPIFVLDKRMEPIDLRYPYAVQDQVTVELPPEFEIENLPPATAFNYQQDLYYQTKFTREPGTLKAVRTMVVGNFAYKVEEYPQLRDFYQKVNAADKELAVLQLKPGP